MLWGATVRSPHPHARIVSIDLRRCLAVPGVRAALTHEDVPGLNAHGHLVADQPVLAVNEVHYHGQPVAVVAADDPRTAREAAALVDVRYELLTPVTDACAALATDAPLLGNQSNVVREVPIRKGTAQDGHLPAAPVVVYGEYVVRTQDQAFLGPESGLVIPYPDGGVEVHAATQWLHADHHQIAESLGLPGELVRVEAAGTGGAFGGREDLSMQIHAAMLALRTGRPVAICYSRDESFLGHVHRHPAVLRYEHGADRNGQLLYVKADILLDGGAYTSTSAIVAANAARSAVGPYEVANVWVDSRAVFTNNPPNGAMRGFGSVQTCFAYESQMDQLAARLAMDPVDLRCVNAVAEGSSMATGQILDSPAPVAGLLRDVQSQPLPTASAPDRAVRRGVGYAAGFIKTAFVEGVDDYSTAAVEVAVVDGRPVATVTCAACEVGQGTVSLQAQIARDELGVCRVEVHQAGSTFGSAGSSAASRQAYVTGGAVQAAARQVRDGVLAVAAFQLERPVDELRLDNDDVVDNAGVTLLHIAAVLGPTVVSRTVEWHHRRTEPMDPDTGRGDSVLQHTFAAHRVVVEVDVELGTVRLLDVTVAQDVGRAMNPRGVLGQIHGATVQGLGLALMEELPLQDGVVVDTTFGDYLLPTSRDVPPLRVRVWECPDPHAPYGLRGVGEVPIVAIVPAVVNAIRDATGQPLRQVPVRSEHILGLP